MVNKLWGVVIAVLVMLTAVQTVRLHRLEQNLAGGPGNDGVPQRGEHVDLAHARLMLEETPGWDHAAGPEGSLSESLIEAMTAFFESDSERQTPSGPATGARARTGREARETREGASNAARTGRRETNESGRVRRPPNVQPAGESASSPEFDPRRSRQLHVQGRKLIQQGDYDAAVMALQASIAADGTNASSYRALGALYRQLGMTTEELQLYADWSAARPEDALAQYYMASALLRMGADAEVLDALGRFEELSADNLAAYPMSASLYRRLGMPEAEGMVLEAWVDQVPQSFDARQALAQHYQRTGHHEAALAEYQMAVGLIPDNVQAHANLGSAYARLGFYPEAQTSYATAISLRPHDAALHYQLGEVYRRANELPSALAAYESVIALQPESQQAQRAARMMARIERQLATPGKLRG